ncbi:M13 family metallopeptidase [Furfurilactobacillus entadae]|uniref:M13 family metallopeptidase n=1 Tax=Furfurilactobacillus entadae TaxID=2922307 RepID=UPI0035EDC8BA
MTFVNNRIQTLVGGATSADEGSASLKDDLYLGVNGDWLQTATIPDDKPTTGGFADLADNIETTLMKDFGEMLAGTVEPNNVLLANFISYYKLASDYQTRDQKGFKPLLTLLKTVQGLVDYKDLQTHLVAFLKDGVGAPFPISVSPDMKDTKHNAVYAGTPSLILPDTTYYAAGNDAAPQLIATFKAMMTKLLTLAGLPETDVATILDQTVALDAKLAQHQKSSEEKADYPKMYNPQSLTDFGQHSDVIDLTAYVNEALENRVERVIVTDPKYYEALNTVLTPNNFEEWKSWLIVQLVRSWSGHLTDDARVIRGEYQRALSGSKAAFNPQKGAYYLAYHQFNMVVGDYYARKYFGAKAKADVMTMVHRMIDVYKNRLQKNEWLSDETRRQAIVKLDTLIPNVGYPDKIDPLYARFVVTPSEAGGTLFDNALRFNRLAVQANFDEIDQEVDRTMWADMDPATVNAYYDPSNNIIVFPAAILQAPFYSLDQSSAENFGGIGAVMAHEISHAFDNNGAQFDEYGNMHDWWTADDLAHFKTLTQAMIDQFDGISFAGSTVNGKLVVSENVADQGGLSCALEAAKEDPDFSAQAFFTNWAKVWCMKASPAYEQLLLSIDVHAPHKLRANVQAQNLDEFYTAFDVHEGDGMWLAPDERVHIW